MQEKTLNGHINCDQYKYFEKKVVVRLIFFVSIESALIFAVFCADEDGYDQLGGLCQQWIELLLSRG